MKILAIGDSFLPVDVLERGLAPLRVDHELEFVQIDQTVQFEPRSESEHRLREFEGNPRDVRDLLNGHEVLVVHGAPVTDQVLDHGALRLICCARGGPVNIDTVSATARGIPVVTTPGKNAESVADQTVAFMIMLARRFPAAQRFLIEGNSVTSTFEGGQFLGHDLGGHTLGLVGYGNVGRRVAIRARAFGVSIVVYDPYVATADRDPGDWVDSLDELLGRSDFVSLHARATPDNRHMFGRAAFAAMRPRSYFINTARESLVDEDALKDALISGQLGGAGLDVFEHSPTPGVHPLLQHPNVILTPHVGGATHETLMRGIDMIVAEVGRFDRGEPLVNVADRQAIQE